MCKIPRHHEPVKHLMFLASLQIPWENTTCNVSHETQKAPHPFRSGYYNSHHHPHSSGAFKQLISHMLCFATHSEVHVTLVSDGSDSFATHSPGPPFCHRASRSEQRALASSLSHRHLWKGRAPPSIHCAAIPSAPTPLHGGCIGYHQGTWPYHHTVARLWRGRARSTTASSKPPKPPGRDANAYPGRHL